MDIKVVHKGLKMQNLSENHPHDNNKHLTQLIHQ